MEQSVDIGESLVVLEKEVRMDQQQEEVVDEAQTATAAVALERTPVHVRINGLAEGLSYSTQGGSVNLIYTIHFVNTSLSMLGEFSKLFLYSLLCTFPQHSSPLPKKSSVRFGRQEEEDLHATYFMPEENFPYFLNLASSQSAVKLLLLSSIIFLSSCSLGYFLHFLPLRPIQFGQPIASF